MKTKAETFAAIEHELIVSCQSLPEEPMHSPFIMGKMAYSAMKGGAKGISANSVEDSKEIKKMWICRSSALLKVFTSDLMYSSHRL